MSVRFQRYHRKNKRVLAQFKPGTVERARTFNIYGQKYVYVIEVILDENPNKVVKFIPQDVEELTKEKL